MGTGAGVNTGTIPAVAKPAIGDFDGDGKADIKWRTVTGTSDTMIVWSAGVAPPNGQIPFAGPGADFAVAATGDFDGDGQSDLYFRSTTTGHSIIWYSGLPWRTVDMGVVDLGWQIGAAGNFTRNRWTTDLYVHTGTNQMYILPNGNPALARFVGIVTDPTWSVVGAGNFDFWLARERAVAI
jgi:hypothetical protein